MMCGSKRKREVLVRKGRQKFGRESFIYYKWIFRILHDARWLNWSTEWSYCADTSSLRTYSWVSLSSQTCSGFHWVKNWGPKITEMLGCLLGTEVARISSLLHVGGFHCLLCNYCRLWIHREIQVQTHKHTLTCRHTRTHAHTRTHTCGTHMHTCMHMHTHTHKWGHQV